jgi:hypothetical protein
MSVVVMGAVEEYAHTYGMNMVSQFAKLFQGQDIPLKALVRAGNLKIPKTTAIFNMSSATECPSLKLGLCKAIVLKKKLMELGRLEEKNVCYAVKSERDYRPAVKPYRDRQETFWKEISAEAFVIQFVIINASKRKKFDMIRLNEAGDFHTQACLDKAEKIAKLLSKFDVTVYCYTSRDDLDYTKRKYLRVNRSLNTLQEYEPVEGLANEFLMIPKEDGKDHKKWPKGYAKCPADCRVCDRCSIEGKKTFIIQH